MSTDRTHGHIKKKKRKKRSTKGLNKLAASKGSTANKIKAKNKRTKQTIDKLFN